MHVLAATGLMSWPDWVVLIAYLGGIVAVGMWFGRFTNSTSDFFFGGQRFSWWLVAVSCIATLIGSYSFIQYSQVGFDHGFSSLIPYTNEWFVLPLFLLGWLPIIYYNRVVSVPEYFERRFDRRTRIAVLVVMLVYLQGYIGINLLTMGEVLDTVMLGQDKAAADAPGGVDWSVIGFAVVMAVLSAMYLHAGGQTSVMMTDLFQGVLLLVAGLSVVVLGIAAVGGLGAFLTALPPAHRQPFAQFNDPPGFHFIGNFWGDSVTGTFAFWMINQGVMMRFLSAKSVRDGRKAMLVVVLVLMPIAAIAVGGAGWIGQAMVAQGGTLPDDLKGLNGNNAFVKVASHVCHYGLFGLVIAAVVAALMSTLDTLITAVSAIAVNDIWKQVRPGEDDAHYLHVARRVAIGSTVLGLLMLPAFMQFTTIYEALSAVINLSIPPLIVVVLLGISWPRFTSRAAFWTVAAGSLAILASLIFPALIEPFAHGVRPETGKPSFAQFTYMRGLYGVVVSLVVAVAVTLLDRRGAGLQPASQSHEGLTLATLGAAMRRFKNGEPNEQAPGESVVLEMEVIETDSTDLPGEISLPAAAMESLAAKPGDLLYLSDARPWLGGFRSVHVRAGTPSEDAKVRVPRRAVEQSHLLPDRAVRVEKIL